MIRTQGDGTENPEVTQETRTRKALRSTSSNDDNINDNNLKSLGREFISKKIQSSSSTSSYYNPTVQQDNVINFPREVKPKGKKFYLIPKLITKGNNLTLVKNKTPKLILMEPYRVSYNLLMMIKS